MSRARGDLDAETIRSLLDELGARLEQLGVEARVYIVGGAAIALRYGGERRTADVDAHVLSARTAVEAAVSELASKHRLPPDWLNTSAAAFLPPIDPAIDGDETVTGALSVVVASPEVLLSMKMLADRERDVPDLVRLVQHMALDRPDDVVAIVRRTYPDGVGWREPTDDELRLTAAEIIAAAHPPAHPYE